MDEGRAMTIMIKPNFIDSPYFVPEFDNWHLKPGAPEEVVKEFDEWMKIHEKLQTIGKKEKDS
jgi:SH3-like domain-containing protein